VLQDDRKIEKLETRKTRRNGLDKRPRSSSRVFPDPVSILDL